MEESLEEGFRAVLRELPAVFDPLNIQTLALSQIIGVDHRVTALDKLIQDRLMVELTRDGRYKIVEREKIEKVFKEIKLNLSDAIDPATAINAGKLLRADALLTGTSFDLENEFGVNIRIIASQNGQVIRGLELRVAKDRRARALFSQEVTQEPRGTYPPLQLEMYVIASREREFMIIQEGSVLHSGDRFQVRFRTNADCYFYVVLVEQGGRAQFLFPSVEVPADNKVSGGVHKVLPGMDYWFFLDNRPGVETILGLASYAALDTRKLATQLQEGAATGSVRGLASVDPEESLSQQIIGLQRRSPVATRGSVSDGSPIDREVYRRGGVRFILRGSGGVVQGPRQVIELPDAQKIQRVVDIVHGYTNAVQAITYVHR
jgi:hypothetical protein